MPIKFESLTLYSIMELSERMNITATTLRAYLKEGLLRGRKVAGKWYVSEDSLREYFNQTQPETAKSGESLNRSLGN